MTFLTCSLISASHFSRNMAFTRESGSLINTNTLVKKALLETCAKGGLFFIKFHYIYPHSGSMEMGVIFAMNVPLNGTKSHYS